MCEWWQIRAKIDQAEVKWLEKASHVVVATASKHVQTESTGDIGPVRRASSKGSEQHTRMSPMKREMPLMTRKELFSRISGA